jgi:quercetin 2,3-dioxygenase
MDPAGEGRVAAELRAVILPRETTSATKFRRIASRNASDGSVEISWDAKLYAALLKPGEEVAHQFAAGRRWLQVARGAVELNGKPLAQGDGAAIGDEKKPSLKGRDDAELLRFDLA